MFKSDVVWLLAMLFADHLVQMVKNAEDLQIMLNDFRVSLRIIIAKIVVVELKNAIVCDIEIQGVNRASTRI